MKCTVDNYRAGWAIEQFLAHRFPYHSLEAWSRRIQDGQVLLNGAPVRPGDPVRRDDLIQYTMMHAEPEVDFNYEVVYEDGDLLAVSKSGNIPVHACGVYITNTLIAVLKNKFGPDINLAHRLDRETSGLVVLSKNKAAARVLGRMFERGEVIKKYITIVYGQVEEESFEIDAPIGPVGSGRRETIRPDSDEIERKRASFLPKRRVDFESGKPAVTRFERVAYHGQFTVLRAFPTTGRTNQIRVHLAYYNHPVVGDKVYGLRGPLKEECVRDGLTAGVREALVMDRQALHCAELEFAHPSSGEIVRLSAPVPDDMKWAVGN